MPTKNLMDVVERPTVVRQQDHNLGHLRLRHIETNELILIPTPSDDPNDPLNWSKARRVYCAILISFAVFFCNFLAAGPTVAIVGYVVDFTGVTPEDPAFPGAIAKIAYLFTTSALLQGVSNFFWMPLIVKYGRRPVYVISFTCYTITAIWGGVATTYSSELASRILLGFFAGAGECLAPVSISDLFFLHERGFYMSIYTAALSAGVSAGVIIDGLITINHGWRYINWVATALIGGMTVLVFFTLPETSHERDPNRAGPTTTVNDPKSVDALSQSSEHKEHSSDSEPGLNTSSDHKPTKSYFRNMKLFHGVYTQEKLWKLAVRSAILIVIPPVLWATLVMSVLIGFLVAISSNFSSAFQTTYGFQPYQAGLSFISGLIGTLLGIATGSVSDYVADYFTRRNGGIREPEFRLPAMVIALVAGPLGLVIYGVGIAHSWPWIVPTLGLGFLSFAIAQGTNVSLVYVIDCYRPIAGETVVTQLAYKSCFGFLLSFYTNPWIDAQGYAGAFGTMAALSAGVILLWVPLYFWGKSLRHKTLQWHVVKSLIDWDGDRETGE